MSLMASTPLPPARLRTEGLWLTVSLGLIMAPHWAHLPALCMGLALLCLLLRAWQLHQHAQPWPRWVFGLGVGLAFGLTWLQYATFASKDAGVCLVVMLSALKNLETRQRRDLFVVVLSGLLLMLTHFLYSQAFALTVMMSLAVMALLATLVRASNPVQDPGAKTALQQSAKLVLLGTPIMVVMFVLFPRIGPLWGWPEPQAVGQIGLSDQLQLGDIAQMTQDDRVALRIRWNEGAPNPQTLYLRGPVLSQFDGAQWTPSTSDDHMPTPTAVSDLPGAALDYELFLEPSSLTSIPTVETTTSLWTPGGVSLDWHQDGSWRSEAPLQRPLRVHAKGHRAPLPVQPLSPTELQDLLWIPPTSNPRTVAWARSQIGANAREYPNTAVRQLLQQVVMQKYRYTLTGLNRTQAPAHLAVDAFWLDTREGYCEHYAAAFALILRSIGIPARIVTGYLGADIQPIDGQWVVRQNRAHAWVEYWHPQMGWQSVDPTTAILPELVAREPGLRPPAGAVERLGLSTRQSLWRTLNHTAEWLQHQWRLNVLGYSNQQQMDLLKTLGWHHPSTPDMLWLAGVAVAMLLSLWALWQALVSPKADPWQRLYRDLGHWLASAGLRYPAHTPPHTLARLVQARWGEAGADLARELLALDHLRFGPTAPEGLPLTLKTLRKRLRQAIRRMPAPAPQD